MNVFYVVEYTEIVTYRATIPAHNATEAKEKLKNGDYTDVIETDSYLHNIKSVKLEDIND